MFWIPGIFIAFYILFMNSFDKYVEYTNAKLLSEKFKDKDLLYYISTKYKDYNKVLIVIIFFILFELAYFISGLFTPIWIFSTAYIIYTIISQISSKIKKEKPIEKIIQKARLKDFKSSDIKFQRLLKLNEFKKTKINRWTIYIYPIVKIIVFMLIIILHYHYKIL